ncbi:sialate O-acetylesterase-like [Clavelina lepadiformis]|uniref:sialate O-acetylesterase-like n=1 Tax=Clavelina lepadiformis TaxID=159417 RepID=UPI004042B6EA
MIFIKVSFVSLLCFVQSHASSQANGNFSFASYFQEDMILQMKPHQAQLWGYGTVGAVVNVSLNQDVYSTRVKAGHDGQGVWLVAIRPHDAGGPVTFQAVQDDHGLLSWILLKNVLFGDVWICGGQSNMQFTMSMVINATKEIAAASNYTDIRVMTPAQVESDSPLYDLKSIEESWSIPSSDSLGAKAWSYFSAVCWLYGRYVYDEIKVPIGLISPNWGGTPVETWSSHRALSKCGLQDRSASFRFNNKVPTSNSVLWNAMIHPLLNMTVKGAIWYQGEANTYYHKDVYSCSFPAMIEDWRKSWHQGTMGHSDPQFPFGFVQLANDEGPDDGSFPVIRWHQTADYGYVPNPKMPNTFMAVAMDLPDSDSPYGAIHPRDKQDVARRLSYGGLNIAYKRPIDPQGPIPSSGVRSADGRVVLTYPNHQHLIVSEQGNFQVCCNFSKCDHQKASPDPDWLWAPITSHTHRSVTLSAKVCVEKGGYASVVRYAWSLTPCKFKQCSVYNHIGLPAPPYVITLGDI